MTTGLNTSDAKQRSNCKPITYRGYAFIALWATIAILGSIFSGYQIISFINQTKFEENAKYQMESSNAYINSANESLQDTGSKVHHNTTEVRVGIYLDHIKEFDIKESKWTADFLIWFAWHGNKVTPQKDFRVINADVDEDNIKYITNSPDTHNQYYIYEVKKASITENFDPRLYPLDNQSISIKIEDNLHDINSLNFVADDNNSTISDRVNLTGLEIADWHSAVIKDAYRTNFGSPSKKLSNTQIYSQYNFIILIERSDKVLLFLKLFQGLIVAVFVSMLALFIKPTWVDPRFGLGVGGLFAAVANNYIVSSALPVAGIVTLAGLVHGIGITIIFFTIFQSVLSLYIYETFEEKSLSKLFDRVSFVLFTIIFVTTIVAVIWSGIRV